MNLPLDANEIAPLLYQGSVPPRGPVLRELGFSAVVLCAMEFQPPASSFEGIDVIHAPNDDNAQRSPTRQELNIAIGAARQTAARIRDGKKVLVTCMAGLNRSGLVSALTLHFLNGWPGNECVNRVQANRENALCNPQFVKVLNHIHPRTEVQQQKPFIFLADGSKHTF